MIGKRIAGLRIKKGLTQDEFARILGVSRSALSLWEQGRRKVDQEVLPVIANYFNCSTDYLLTGKPDSLVPEKKITPADLAGENIGESKKGPFELTDYLLIENEVTYMGARLTEDEIITCRDLIEVAIRPKLPKIIPIYPPLPPRDYSKIPKIEDIDPEQIPLPIEFMWKDERINRYEYFQAEGRLPTDEDWKNLVKNYKYQPPEG